MGSEKVGCSTKGEARTVSEVLGCWSPHLLETFVLGQMAYLASSLVQRALRLAIASRKHRRKALSESWVDHVSELFLPPISECSHELAAFRVLSKKVVSSFATERHHHDQARVCSPIVT